MVLALTGARWDWYSPHWKNAPAQLPVGQVWSSLLIACRYPVPYPRAAQNTCPLLWLTHQRGPRGLKNQQRSAHKLTTHKLIAQELTLHELTTHKLTIHKLTTHKLISQELTTHKLTMHELTAQELTTHELVTHCPP